MGRNSPVAIVAFEVSQSTYNGSIGNAGFQVSKQSLGPNLIINPTGYKVIVGTTTSIGDCGLQVKGNQYVSGNISMDTIYQPILYTTHQCKLSFNRKQAPTHYFV